MNGAEDGGHDLRVIAGRRARCALCRATWTSLARARAAVLSWPCCGHPVCHGHPLDRLHWTDVRWHGRGSTDALCDESACPVCGPVPPCPCDVCRELLVVKALHEVVQDGASGPFVALSDIPDHTDEPALRAALELAIGIDPTAS